MALICKHRTLLLFFALIIMTTYNLFIYFFTAYPFNVPRNYMADPIPTRRDLARAIMKVQREIEVKTEMSKDMDNTWAERLRVVAAELDPRVATSRTGPELVADASQVSVGSETVAQQHVMKVCPEEYKGRAFDEDMKLNFAKIKCEAQEFREVLTILIPTKRWEPRRIDRILNQIRSHYDIDVVVVTHGYMAKSFESKNIIIKRFSADKSESEAVNEVISNIKTPYTLIAHSLIHFDVESNLERLVRVLEENHKATVASGAYRDANGLWHHGCLQTTAENYALEYVRGYEHSRNECMYCDDVLGPFVVRTKFLSAVFLTVAMEGAIAYRDWFLNVRLDRKLVMSCPDVMFYVESEPKMGKSDWHEIARKWSVETIHSFDGSNFHFSCEDAQISCNHLMKTVSSFLVPPCCRKVFHRELGYVQNCADEIGVHYELSAGSLLGAVKMDGMLPWDFDSDIITDCGDKERWMSKGYECLAKKGCTLKSVIGNYWAANCEASTIDLNCYDNRTRKLTSEYRQVPTVAEFNDVPSRVPLNPGRVCRNYFGEDYLKHAVHWRYSSEAIIPQDDGSGQTPGLWINCVVPAFHSCIDHFPVDGNLKFHKPKCSNS